MCSEVTINTLEPIAIMFALSKEISIREFYSCVVQPPLVKSFKMIPFELVPEKNAFRIFLNRFFYFSDIDECSREDDDCGQLCINTFGSYKCICKDGYYLHHDGKTCLGKILRSAV